MGRVIILASVALLGFLVGVAGFFAYAMASSLGIDFMAALATPGRYIASFAASVWSFRSFFISGVFLSGLAGAVLAVVVVVVLVYAFHKSP